MASLGGNILPLVGFNLHAFFTGITGGLLFFAGLIKLSHKRASQKSDQKRQDDDEPGLISALLLFCYGCFFKPHSGSGKANQQGALESFYAGQASAVRLPKMIGFQMYLVCPTDQHASTVRCDQKATPQRP